MLSLLRSKYRTLNTVRVFKDALIHNLNLYRTLLPNQAICPVLKSNAYGHGLITVAKILEREKPEFFVVDSLYEAYRIKKAGVKTPLLILGYTFPENLSKKSLPFHFTAFDMEVAEVLAKIKVPVHLEIDTGMARMGFTLETLENNLGRMKEMKLNIVGVFTHFADADNPENTEYNDMQLALFKKALNMVKKAGFEPKWIHAGNSAGSIKTKLPELNMARVGLSLYGISPLDDKDTWHPKLKELQPAMEIASSLIAIRQLKKGDKVSYGCSYEAPRDMTIGVIPFGYYEGLPRSLSNQGEIVGRVCMNHTMIDLTGKKAEIGDEYLVYTKKGQKSVREYAKKAKTISWELMVRIAESVKREAL